MEKSEDVKKDQPVAQVLTSAPATEQPTAPQPPTPPAPPIPKEIVETPKPAPVPSGGQEEPILNLLKDPYKLRNMSWKDYDKVIGRRK